MGWADHHIAKLRSGASVEFRPVGNSMKGKINSGQLVRVEPLTGELAEGDIVLCTVRGRAFLHLVQLTTRDSVCIGNNKGHTNGWTSKQNVFGRVTHVSD